jgi:hypothetical protein
MPLFYIPKPRQFHYQPRFYDPQKERWEALKQKYADEQNPKGVSEEELEYFERRVRNLENPERDKLTWKDLFRKRKVRRFEYKPRFSTNGQELMSELPDNATERVEQYKKAHTKMKRRFDFHETVKRKQRKPWVTVALVFVAAYLCYRYYGVVVQFFYDIFF